MGNVSASVHQTLMQHAGRSSLLITQPHYYSPRRTPFRAAANLPHKRGKALQGCAGPACALMSGEQGSDFTFDLARPLSALPKQNPLLARATVVDRSQPAQAQQPQPVAPLQLQQQQPQEQDAAGDGMGAALSTPLPELSRHNKNRLVPHRPKPHAAARPRQKVMYEKGYSQMDWVRLTQKDPDLAGLRGAPLRRDISLEEVAQHASEADAWTVLRGRVYNMTPYLRFHPGGVPLLLKAAGRDGTALFNKYHAWVNADFLLEKCLVGFLAQPAPAEAGSMPPPPPVAVRQPQQQAQQQQAPEQEQQQQQDEQQAEVEEQMRQAVEQQLPSGSPQQQRLQQLSKLPPPRFSEGVGLEARQAQF